MSKDIYNKEGYVSTLVEDDVITVTWEKLFDAETIYGSCNAQLEVVKEGKIKAIIIDISHADGTPPMECQNWFGEVLFPGYKESPNFKGLINVLPANAITKMGANRWKQTAMSSEFGFNVFETGSLSDAQDLAATMN